MNSSVDEQDVREYCLHHPLSRPNVNLSNIICVVFIMECMVLGLSLLAHRHVGWCIWDCENGMNILIILLFCKPICKTIVRLYQKCASESTRRRCRCMPSCSEYALLALDKYVWPKALWKIYKRLTHTCMEPGYKVDYP